MCLMASHLVLSEMAGSILSRMPRVPVVADQPWHACLRRTRPRLDEIEHTGMMALGDTEVKT